MLNTRQLGDMKLFQIIEYSGPTHDTAWLFPDLDPAFLLDNQTWLSPNHWMPATNRMIFTMPIFVLKTARDIIVIDTGVGNFRKRRSSSQHMINTPFIEWLEAIGASPDKVTHVVNTHLHGDHVGWNTHLTNNGWEPFFKNAQYHMPRADLDSWMTRYQTGEREVYGRAFAECVLPIVDAGMASFVQDGDTVADCLVAKSAPGHTPGQMTFTLQTDREYIFSADVIHSPAQVYHPTVNTRWCELPEVARDTRRNLLEHAAVNGSILFTAHAMDLTGWQISRGESGFEWNGR